MSNLRFDPQTGDQIVRDYSAGRLSWRQVREASGVEDFSEMLVALGRLGLKLPRAPIDRPSEAKQWLREWLEQRPHTAQ